MKTNKRIFNVRINIPCNFQQNIRTEKYMKMAHFERDLQRRRIPASSGDESAKSRDSRE